MDEIGYAARQGKTRPQKESGPTKEAAQDKARSSNHSLNAGASLQGDACSCRAMGHCPTCVAWAALIDKIRGGRQ